MFLMFCGVLLMAASVAGPSGQIAFLSGLEQESRVLSILDIDARKVTPIGRGQRDNNPVWSPRGDRIAFESVQDGPRIFVVNADGSDMMMIPSGGSWERWPSWAPDGTRLAYISSNGDVQSQKLKVFSFEENREFSWGEVSAEGEQLPPLFRPVWLGKSLLVALLQAKLQESSGQLPPGWADVEPDPQNTLLAIGLVGKPMALTTGVFVVMPKQLLPLPDDVMPSRGTYVEWNVAPSPNGKWVAFESNDGGDREVFVLSSKGAYDISNHRAADWNPVWSPKGDTLAIESFRDGRRGIYLVDPSTAHVRPLVVSANADCWAPTWSPDGKWVAFVSTLTGNPELWLIKVSSGEKTQLTSTGVENLNPMWRPGRRK